MPLKFFQALLGAPQMEAEMGKPPTIKGGITVSNLSHDRIDVEMARGRVEVRNAGNRVVIFKRSTETWNGERAASA